MPGPTRAPASVTVLRGNPAKAAQTPSTGRTVAPLPDPPADLSRAARAEWDRVTAACGDALRAEDFAALMTYVTAWDRHEEACASIRDIGLLVTNSRGDYVKNPAVQIVNDAVKVLALYAAKFGLSPRDRLNLGVPEGEGDDGRDPFGAAA